MALVADPSRHEGIGCPSEGCGGHLTVTRRDGRFWEHRGVMINLPRNLAVPQCTKCLTYWLDDQLIAVVSEILEGSYLFHREMIVEARERFERRLVA